MAKVSSQRALRLPESLKYLEDKDDFFSPDSVEKIQQTRFEETVVKGANQPKFGGFNKNGNTRRGRNETLANTSR
jgi:hypothetical protein